MINTTILNQEIIQNRSSWKSLHVGLLYTTILVTIIGCTKKQSQETQTENAPTQNVTVETKEMTPVDVSPQTILSSTDPIDMSAVVPKLIEIAAALDYWNGGMDNTTIIEYDNVDHVIQDTYGNRLHISPDTWKQVVRYVNARVENQEPDGYVIRATGYERYDRDMETIVRLQQSRSRDVVRYSYQVTVIIDKDQNTVKLKWVTTGRLDG